MKASCYVRDAGVRVYGHHSKSVDQLCKVANPAGGQLNRQNPLFPVTVRA